MPMFELLLDDNTTVVWEGVNELDAGQRYVDMHRTKVVVAYRHAPRHGVFIADPNRIVEPGEDKRRS